MTAPLRFFPASAMAYADKQKWDLERAREKWEDGYNDIPGEGRDPYFRLCFGHDDPFNAEFERIAHALLEPLLQHLVYEEKVMIELDHLHIDLSGMNLIEASAGTGKTYAIACLYLRLLIEKDLTPEQILVVTLH